MDEYLEKIVGDAFKREVDQEENVVRSLPFFAASLGVTVAVFQQVLSRFPPMRLGFFEIVDYSLLVIAAGIFAGILFRLFQAVRRSAYLYPPAETEMLQWADDLLAAALAAGRSPENAANESRDEVRRFYVRALAEAAEHNRALNVRKTRARTSGLSALIFLLGLAFVLAAAIFGERQVVGRHRGGSHEDGKSIRQEGRAAFDRTSPATAEAARDAGRVEGREVPGRAGSRADEREDTAVSDGTKSNSTPAPAPAQKPEPPKMQLVQKIDRVHGTALDHGIGRATNRPKPQPQTQPKGPDEAK